METTGRRRAWVVCTVTLLLTAAFLGFFASGSQGAKAASATDKSPASVRVETAIERVRWNGPAGHCSELAGYDLRAVVRKHKRAAPAGGALVRCDPFEERPTLVDVRERELILGLQLHRATAGEHRDAGRLDDRVRVDRERAGALGVARAREVG